ncbi:MAG TPA: aldolase [Micromonosporaceae bacterium]
MDDLTALLEIRVHRPEAIAQAAHRRVRRESPVGPGGRLLIIAADHPARGALRAGDRPLAMADRMRLLDRLRLALSRPGVDGLLATADVIEDLLLLGALDGEPVLDNKVVIGSMNRGGLAGTAFEIDDRFTGYHADALHRMRFDGGKMLFRIDPADPATVATMQACARAVDQLAERGLMAMVEPFISHRVDGRSRNDLSPEAVTRSLTVASGLGATSAYTWLKVPVVDDMERVLSAATLPVLLLGGEVPADPDATYARWQQALRLPTVRGLVVGRALLYPPDDNVSGAVDTAASLLEGAP